MLTANFPGIVILNLISYIIKLVFSLYVNFQKK